MAVTWIDECGRRLPRNKRVGMANAVRIVLRDRSSRNNDQAVAMMRVPARAGRGSSDGVDWLPGIALHIKVRRAFGFLQRHPLRFVVSVVVHVSTGVHNRGLVQDLKFRKRTRSKRRGFKSDRRRCPHMN